MKKLIMVAAVAALLVGCGKNYSNGSRVGVVTKLSEKGLIWDSWEGEMNMGGVRDKHTDAGTVSVPNAFQFNVDPAAVPKVKEALRSGKRVELVYREWAVSPLSIGDSHVVIDVKEAQ
jgi:hypothetical protein